MVKLAVVAFAAAYTFGAGSIIHLLATEGSIGLAITVFFIALGAGLMCLDEIIRYSEGSEDDE